MALPDILKKITEEAQNQVRIIESETETQKKEIQKKYDAYMIQDAQNIELKTKHALESLQKKMQSLLKRESAKMNLEMKHEVLSSILKDFLRTLENADEKTYGQILQKLFSHIRVPSGKIYAPAQRLEVTTKNAPQGFHVVPHKDIQGGFILEMGDTVIDNTFKTLIEKEYREQLHLYLSQELKLT